MKPYISRLITGIGIIIIGILLLLGNLDVLNFSELARTWWPLVIVGAGILIFINDIRNYIWGVFVLGSGLILQLNQLDLLDVNPWEFFWPVIIILVGISIIMNRSVGRRRVSKAESDDMTAVMGAQDQKNLSEDFKGSKITTIMGGVKLDLRKAKIKKEATVQIFSFWGGVELIVPRDIIIKNQTSCIMGGVDNKAESDEATKNAPILYVTGDVIMAGVDIKN